MSLSFALKLSLPIFTVFGLAQIGAGVFVDHSSLLAATSTHHDEGEGMYTDI